MSLLFKIVHARQKAIKDDELGVDVKITASTVCKENRNKRTEETYISFEKVRRIWHSLETSTKKLPVSLPSFIYILI